MRGTDHSNMIDASDPYAQQGRFDDNETDFVEVIYTYQRLMKDGAEGIYCTVWHTKETESFGKVACNGMIVVDDDEAIVFDTPVNNEVSEELLKWLKSNFLLF